MFVPRPLHITEAAVKFNGSVCATIFDLVLFCTQNARELLARQQGSCSISATWKGTWKLDTMIGCWTCWKNMGPAGAVPYAPR